MKLLERITHKLFRYSTTYSQCGEDRIIAHLLKCLERENISYLDIGTNHPKIFNNTYYFYLNGGKGICVEPNPILCEKIKAARPHDKCLNVGVGSTNSEKLDFYILNVDTLSTFSKVGADKLQESGRFKIKNTIKIPVINFNDLLKKNFNSPPDLVSIDVEDLNEEIVASIDFQMRPLIFCVETLLFATDKKNEKISFINQHFINNNYSVYADTFINTIFVDNNVFKIS
jgi:FkbM family methyltransferase